MSIDTITRDLQTAIATADDAMAIAMLTLHYERTGTPVPERLPLPPSDALIAPILASAGCGSHKRTINVSKGMGTSVGPLYSYWDGGSRHHYILIRDGKRAPLYIGGCPGFSNPVAATPILDGDAFITISENTGERYIYIDIFGDAAWEAKCDGTEGQDRESYSDTQDRDNYTA